MRFFQSIFAVAVIVIGCSILTAAPAEGGGGEYLCHDIDTGNTCIGENYCCITPEGSCFTSVDVCESLCEGEEEVEGATCLV